MTASTIMWLLAACTLTLAGVATALLPVRRPARRQSDRVGT